MSEKIGQYGSGDKIADNNETKGNDYVKQTDKSNSSTDPLQESLGKNTQADPESSEPTQPKDTSSSGGYGVNSEGDSFSAANQTGAADKTEGGQLS